MHLGTALVPPAMCKPNVVLTEALFLIPCCPRQVHCVAQSCCCVPAGGVRPACACCCCQHVLDGCYHVEELQWGLTCRGAQRFRYRDVRDEVSVGSGSSNDCQVARREAKHVLDFCKVECVRRLATTIVPSLLYVVNTDSNEAWDC